MAGKAQIEAAISYIEARLTEPFSVRDVAAAVGYSPFHFHRLFLAVTGETPAAFVRRRRLIESAKELVLSEKRMLDVALDFQYESQEAFTRSFRRQFGVTPGQYRRWHSQAQPAGPPPHAMTQGGYSMEPRIEEKDAMTLIGMIYFGDNQNGEIGQLWGEFNPRVDQIPHTLPDAAFGFCFTDDRSNPSFWYLASVAVAQLGDIPAEMVAKTVPAHTYAIFTHRGPVSNLHETYGHAYTAWLPSSDYELAAQFDFEYYSPRFLGPEDPASETDIYIPIRPKS